MARVLLIKARPEEDAANNVVMPPMGLMYIASYLRQFGHEVRIVDSQLRTFSLEGWRREVAAFAPDVVGISALTTSAGYMHTLAQIAKKTHPLARVIVGSHHPSCYPEETLQDPHIDYVGIGEGEQTVKELVDALEHGKDPALVSGLVFRQDGEIVRSPPRATLWQLDELPFPAWDLVDIEAYRFHKPMGVQVLQRRCQRYMSLATSRGCPFRCFYCHDLHGKRFRSRSPENVLAEIDELYHRYKIREIYIIDDIFNFDLQRAKAILQGIVGRRYNLKLHFPNALRGDMVDREFLDLLKEAGTFFLAIAVDSASERVQKLSHRRLKFDKVQDTISYATKKGIFTLGNFILGFPDETEDEMLETIRFARESDFHAAFFYILTPFPGSELERIYRNQIPRGLHDFNQYVTDRVVWQASKLSDEELYRMRRYAYLQFYLKPGRFFKGPLRYFFYRLLYFTLELPNVTVLPWRERGKSLAAAKPA